MRNLPVHIVEVISGKEAVASPSAIHVITLLLILYPSSHFKLQLSSVNLWLQLPIVRCGIEDTFGLSQTAAKKYIWRDIFDGKVARWHHTTTTRYETLISWKISGYTFIWLQTCLWLNVITIKTS